MKKQNNTLTGHYWFWVVVILVVGVLGYVLKLDMPDKNGTRGDTQKAMSGGVRLVLEVNNQRRIFEGPANEGTTILDALYYASKAGNLDLRYYVDGGKVIVDSLAKIFPVVNKDWHFYLNGKLVDSTAINKIPARKGDVIEVKFE